MTGAEYMNYRKGKYATLPTKQYRQSWPPPISGKSGAPTAAGCKQSETYEEFLSEAVIEAEHRVPIVVLHEKQMKYEDSYVILKIKDFKEITNEQGMDTRTSTVQTDGKNMG